MRKRCDICQGRRSVRLPVWSELSAVRPSADEVLTPIGETAREFPCPQCSEMVAEKRLCLLQEHSTLDTRIDNPDYVRAVEKDAAHRFVVKLLEDGFITFEWGEVNDRDMRRPLRATLGVVSKEEVTSLEGRVEDAVAAEREACAKIADEHGNMENWSIGAEGDRQRWHWESEAGDEIARTIRARK